METRTVEQVESWDSRPFSGGFGGLHDLADREFSGAVRASGTWLFMLNGRVVGVFDGSIDDLEDAEGTVFAAPHPSLPLLFSMQAQGGDTRAKYYTNDTPLTEVDSTLTDGGFTGFVELSENVLSGDYYVVYYGGRSMSVAFVGESGRVVSGEDAFDRAADEVGIYEVTDVDVEVVDVPKPEPDSTDESAGRQSGAGAAAGGGGGAAAGGATAAGNSTAAGEESAAGSVGDATESPVSEPSTDRQTADREQSSNTTEAERTGPGSPGAEPAATESPATDASTADASTTDASAADASAADASRTDDPASGTAAGRADEARAERSEAASTDGTRTASSKAAGSESTHDERSTPTGSARSEEEWRETTTIPSLNPDRTESSADGAGAGSAAGATATTTAGGATNAGPTTAGPDASSSAAEQSTQASVDDATPTPDRSASERQHEPEGTPSASDGADQADERRQRVEDLESKLKRREQQVAELEERLERAQSEREELERERDALEDQVERLEARLDGEAGAGRGQQLSAAEAFTGTNLFVRYRSKGKATLEDAAEDAADREDVNANLRIEHHTQFDAESVGVNGESFESFLTDTFEYRFVTWLVEDLLYEIRDTGHQSSLQDLYDAITRIDRVDLHGSVDAGPESDDTREEDFDVIVRDRMGNPLLAANLNHSRDPTTGDMMGSLVDAASGVREAHDEFVAAFQVTQSFFEPGALETAENATSGGFLSREKRASFVKLSRKRGYHLCLVESRSGGFHINVPEL